MKIIYLGADSGTSKLQRLAMERLGHTITSVDPYMALSAPFPLWGYHTGYQFLGAFLERYILSRIPIGAYDVAIVDNGEYASPALVKRLKARAGAVVLVCKDNPFTTRDGRRFRLLRKSLSDYDVFVTYRTSSKIAAERLGAREVRRIHFTADEEVHHPISPTAEDWVRYKSEVSFVGTWMPERGPFVERLLQRGVPIRVFGARWDRAPNYKQIKSVVTLGALNTDEYVRAVACSKIAIGLLSKGNADFHTTRSIEIPAIGRLLCAERTYEHLKMYSEMKEAAFWADADECADVCLKLLADPDRLEQIAAAGHERVLKNGHFNEATWRNILQSVAPTSV